MSARDDYQYGERGAQHYTMCDEIDRLRAELDTARQQLAEAETRANNWAFKMTMLVVWTRETCTKAQVVEAQAFVAAAFAQNEALLAAGSTQETQGG